MKKRTDPHVDPVEALRVLVAKHGSQTAAAAALGISVPYINDMLHGKRNVSDEMLDKLGLKRVVVER